MFDWEDDEPVTFMHDHGYAGYREPPPGELPWERVADFADTVMQYREYQQRQRELSEQFAIEREFGVTLADIYALPQVAA